MITVTCHILLLSLINMFILGRDHNPLWGQSDPVIFHCYLLSMSLSIFLGRDHNQSWDHDDPVIFCCYLLAMFYCLFQVVITTHHGITVNLVTCMHSSPYLDTTCFSILHSLSWVIWPLLWLLDGDSTTEWNSNL